MFDTLLIPLALLAMIIGLILIIVPVIPVPAVEWAIALIFAALTGFVRVTPVAAVVMTVLMVIGSTSGFWMPIFGLKGREMSCLGLLAFFVGFALGTFIPIPLCGSFIGGILGVFIVQLAQDRSLKNAVAGSSRALQLTLYGMIAEFIFGVAIIGVFCISLLTTQ
jgi:uncharacterized protein YqgC (DUF456 family)